jgi:hypothetical protein
VKLEICGLTEVYCNKAVRNNRLLGIRTWL